MKLTLALCVLLVLSGCARRITGPNSRAYVDIMQNGITPMRCPCEHNRVVSEESWHDGQRVVETFTLSDFGGWTCTDPTGFWFWATPTYIPPSYDVQGRRKR